MQLGVDMFFGRYLLTRSSMVIVSMAGQLIGTVGFYETPLGLLIVVLLDIVPVELFIDLEFISNRDRLSAS